MIQELNKNGYEAYIVGGCVRDSILGKEPKDWDITTSALPQQVKAVFPKTFDTGIKHGTVTVVIEKENIEVTTYRIESEYENNRKPKEVEFTSSIEKDLGRRDFTINSIAYHPQLGFVDVFNGMEDIRRKCIRAVGNPDKRFSEDALRMLRAIRFSAQLGFRVESMTLKSIANNCSLIKSISQERVKDELTKTLISKNPERFELLHTTGLLKYILPEFDLCFNTLQNNPYHIYNVALHSLKAAAHIQDDRELRWAALLHDIGKPWVKTTATDNTDHFYGHAQKGRQLAETILRRLKFDNKAINMICNLIENHDIDVQPSSKSIRRWVCALGEVIFINLLKLKEADIKAQNPLYSSQRLESINDVLNIFFEIKDTQQCLSLSSLSISGIDLINLGIKPGKEIGFLLNKLLEEVIENPELNTREDLLSLAEQYLKSSVD